VTAKLLVVDDEPRTAELTAELLRRAGYVVDVAVSGADALARARLSPPDLMLLDYEMPDMDAPEVLLARVRGALRDRATTQRVVVRGRLRVDVLRGEAWLGDRALKLERRPLLMLQLLASRTGEVVTRAELLESVWGSSYAGFDHSVEQAVHEVRRALQEPGWIETVRGIGYRFVTAD